MELYEIILDLCPYSYFLNKTKATLERNLIFQISLLPDLPIRGWLSEYWVFRLLLEFSLLSLHRASWSTAPPTDDDDDDDGDKDDQESLFTISGVC